jgi:hypothetical protein
MSYFLKYLKYKNKYLQLKNIIGGNDNDITSNILIINQKLVKLYGLTSKWNDNEKFETYNNIFDEIIKLGYIDESNKKKMSLKLVNLKDINLVNEKDVNILHYLNLTFYNIYNKLNINNLANIYKSYTQKETQHKDTIISILNILKNDITEYNKNILSYNKIKNDTAYSLITKKYDLYIPFNYIDINKVSPQMIQIIDDIYVDLQNKKLYMTNDTVQNFISTLNFVINICNELIELATNNNELFI